MNKPISIRKADSMELWENLEPNRTLYPRAIPYKHKGTTINEDGIRITGTRAWIESVLSRLMPLREFENDMTRIGIAYSEITDKETQRPTGFYRCTVQVHERGGEAQMVNAFIGAIKQAK
jgi:hypothetical protein